MKRQSGLRCCSRHKSQSSSYLTLRSSRFIAVFVITFAETEALLQTTIGLPGRTTKAIAVATGIRPDTLYKWKTTEVHLSPSKADALLLYFINNEPQRLELAETVLAAKNNTL